MPNRQARHDQSVPGTRRFVPNLQHGFVLGLLGLVSLGVAACRSAPTLPLAPLSDSAVRLDLPLVRQDALYDCGLASISALCQYWGVEIPADERTALARTAEKYEGLSGNELCSTLARLGLDAYLFEGTLDRTPTGIYAQVDAGRPPLVMLSADGRGHHYELVLGYDEPRNNMILLDPTKGEILVPVGLFERNWMRCQRFTLLASRRENSALTSNPSSDRHSGDRSTSH